MDKQEQSQTDLTAKLAEVEKKANEGLEALTKKHAEDIKNLKDEIAKKADKAEVEALTKKLDGLQKAYEAKVAEIEKSVEALQKLVDAKADKAYVDAQIAKVDKAIKALDAKIADLRNEVTDELEKKADKADFDALKAAFDAHEKDYKEKVETLNEVVADVKTLKDEIDALKLGKVDKTEVEALKKELGDKINELKDSVDAAVKEIYKYVGARISSLVFNPTTYVDGVEAATVNSFHFLEWKAPKKETPAKDYEQITPPFVDMTLNNAMEVTFHISPVSAAIKENIKDVEVVYNKATTKSAQSVDAAPVKVMSYEVKDGKLIVHMSKDPEFKGELMEGEFYNFAVKVVQNISDADQAKG